MFGVQSKSPYFVLQVSQLTMQIKSLLESDLSYVEVEGEVSGLTYHNSGHVYFSLKDEHAILACVFFRNYARNSIIKLKNGDKIIAKGSLSVYAPRGTYSLNVTQCVYSGVGNLKAQYDQLKKELELRNYFCKNKSLPKFPKKIILLTSQTGAALQDMIKVAKNRLCLCEFILIDTLTQGKEAKYSIAKNLIYADGLNADILVLARGGGSIEDLWSFNEIEVLEAIFACKTPVVSAIGHEIDYLLSDYVADVRAPTPSAAMEMILYDKESLALQLLDMETHLKNTVQSFLYNKQKNLQYLMQSLEICNPCKKIMESQKVIRSLDNALQDSLKRFVLQKQQEVKQYQHALQIFAPIQKIRNFEKILKLLTTNLHEIFSLFLYGKREELNNMQTHMASKGELFLAKKQSMLPHNLSLSITFFLKAKKDNVAYLHDALVTLNPKRNLQNGFAQVLKEGKPILLKDLQKGDYIELIDSTGIKNACIIS